MCITCLMSTKLWSPDRTTSLSFSLHQRIDEEWKEKQRVAVGDLSGIISHRSLNLGDNNNTCLFVSPGRLPPHPPLSEQDCFTLPLPLHEIPASLSVCVRLTRWVHTCMYEVYSPTLSEKPQPLFRSQVGHSKHLFVSSRARCPPLLPVTPGWDEVRKCKRR